jgi:type II secretory pathway component PulM
MRAPQRKERPARGAGSRWNADWAKLTPQERRTLLLIAALFLLGAVVRAMRLSGRL